MHFLCLRSDDEIGPLSPWAVSLAAGVSGSVAAAASHCFDTAKSRSQCIVLPKVCYLFLATLVCFGRDLLASAQQNALQWVFFINKVALVMNVESLCFVLGSLSPRRGSF